MYIHVFTMLAMINFLAIVLPIFECADLGNSVARFIL